MLGASNWTDVFNSTDELDVLDYYEDFEVSRILRGKQSITEYIEEGSELWGKRKNFEISKLVSTQGTKVNI